MENKTENKEITLESYSKETFKFRMIEMTDGTKIRIGPNVLDFFERLLDLKPEYKIQLMNIDPEYLESYLEQSRQKNITELKDFLSKKWFYRETGEACKFNNVYENECIIGLQMTKTQILAKLKSKKISPIIIAKVIEAIKKQEDVFMKD